MPNNRIKLNKTYDPLTRGSIEHPTAPWVGIDRSQDPPVVSREIARLERLIAEYVDGGMRSCSVLIGGDRGAGKTSLIHKVIERLRRRAGEIDRSTPEHETLMLPRPCLVRVHGPRLFDATGSPEQQSTDVLRVIAESVHRTLLDEFGEVLASRAGAGQQEQAAQFRLDLDEGPSEARLREIWTLLSDGNREPESILDSAAGKAMDSHCPPDQAFRELVAVASSMQMVREIRKHRAEEKEREEVRQMADVADGMSAAREYVARATAESASSHKKEFAFWKGFANLMTDGGKLINPLAGFLVGALVFLSIVKSVNDLPIALLTAGLSGFSTTILLNFAAARRQANSLLADSRLESVDRMLPVLLRRVEAAGLFPIIVIDELDKVDGKRMDQLIHNLKYFVADQAFVCFLQGREYYQNVVRQTRGEASSREHSDTFYADRILVSHPPESLLQYLDELLYLEPLIGPHLVDDECMLAFLKHLWSYRAKGHQSDLQKTVAADHAQEYSVNLAAGSTLYDVESYRHQVFYQLAVHAVLTNVQTRLFLRQAPDRLQPLNQVLYGPARIWEEHKWNFIHDDLWRGVATNVAGDSDEFKAAIDHLLHYLTIPNDFWKDVRAGKFEGPFSRDLAFLEPVLGKLSPLIELNRTQGMDRYFWTIGFELQQRSAVAEPDVPAMVKLRGNERDAALKAIQALGNLLSRISQPTVTFAELCSLRVFLKVAWQPTAVWARLVDYTFPANTDFPRLMEGSYPKTLEKKKYQDREIAELHAALHESAKLLRLTVLAACLHCIETNGPINYEGLRSIISDASERAEQTSYDVDRVFEMGLVAAEVRIRKAGGWTEEINRAKEQALGPANDEHEFVKWCGECSFLVARILRGD